MSSIAYSQTLTHLRQVENPNRARPQKPVRSADQDLDETSSRLFKKARPDSLEGTLKYIPPLSTSSNALPLLSTSKNALPLVSGSLPRSLSQAATQEKENMSMATINTAGTSKRPEEMDIKEKNRHFLNAVNQGNLNEVKIFHSAGANIHICNSQKPRGPAINVAMELGHFEIAEYLATQLSEKSIRDKNRTYSPPHIFAFQKICEFSHDQEKVSKYFKIFNLLLNKAKLNQIFCIPADNGILNTETTLIFWLAKLINKERNNKYLNYFSYLLTRGACDGFTFNSYTELLKTLLYSNRVEALKEFVICLSKHLQAKKLIVDFYKYLKPRLDPNNSNHQILYKLLFSYPEKTNKLANALNTVNSYLDNNDEKLTASSDIKTIEKTKRKLSLKFHPDKNDTSGHEVIQKINSAIEHILSTKRNENASIATASSSHQ